MKDFLTFVFGPGLVLFALVAAVQADDDAKAAEAEARRWAHVSPNAPGSFSAPASQPDPRIKWWEGFHSAPASQPAAPAATAPAPLVVWRSDRPDLGSTNPQVSPFVSKPLDSDKAINEAKLRWDRAIASAEGRSLVTLSTWVRASEESPELPDRVAAADAGWVRDRLAVVYAGHPFALRCEVLRQGLREVVFRSSGEGAFMGEIDLVCDVVPGVSLRDDVLPLNEGDACFLVGVVDGVDCVVKKVPYLPNGGIFPVFHLSGATWQQMAAGQVSKRRDETVARWVHQGGPKVLDTMSAAEYVRQLRLKDAK